MFELSAFPAPLAQVFALPAQLLLIALLITAAVIDTRSYRIPNRLTVAGMLLGLACNSWPAVPGATGFLMALGGLAAGLAVLLPLYVLRMTGAGDVKLMAMVGAFVGVQQILQAAVLTFIAGGLVAIAFALWRKALGRMVANAYYAAQSFAGAAISGYNPGPVALANPSVGRVPYALSILAGTAAWLGLRHFVFA
jgi:prepilin peptidase CpaA